MKKNSILILLFGFFIINNCLKGDNIRKPEEIRKAEPMYKNRDMKKVYMKDSNGEEYYDTNDLIQEDREFESKRGAKKRYVDEDNTDDALKAEEEDVYRYNSLDGDKDRLEAKRLGKAREDGEKVEVKDFEDIEDIE